MEFGQNRDEDESWVEVVKRVGYQVGKQRLGRGEEEHKKDKMVTEERKHQENAGKAEKKGRTRKGRRGKRWPEKRRE